MKKMIKTLCAAAALALLGSAAFAKLPPPTEEAKAKAAEAAAKTAWAGKVDAFTLCKAQDRVVAHYKKAPAASDAKPAATGAAGVAPSGACVDPGPFVYVPAGAAPAATPAPAASAADPAKKP
ncbi:MAG TPA: hypothetical protein VFX90_07995 [Rhodoferax sp.]|nr:hypothetical protein [Rhodoferax sp.]